MDPRTPADRDLSSDKVSLLLGSWEASVFNIGWMADLISAGKAQQHSFGGYPNRFTVKVSDFLPLVANGPPSSGGSNTNVSLNLEKIMELPGDHIVTVDVWDQT